jgi:type II secretory pathway component PulF
MALALLLALLAAAAAGYAGAMVLGLTRTRQLQDTPRPGFFRRYMENLRLDLLEAGITDLSPARALSTFIIIGITVGLAFTVFLNYLLVGITAGVLTSTVFMRNWYIGRRAQARRIATIGHVSEAAREIADSVDSGMTPLDALRGYAARAMPGAVSEQLTGVENLVARMILEAIARIERGTNAEESLRLSADDLGNRHFSGLVETYIQSAPVDAKQLSRGLRRLAQEVDYSLRLRSERLTAIRQPALSNQLVGGVIILIILVMMTMIPRAGEFYQNPLGQIALVLGAGWWYLGSRILQSGWEDEL